MVHHLENSRKEANLAQLIVWMNTEMKSKMRATTPLRSTGPQTRHLVGYIGSELNAPKSGLPNKCWICKNSSHWAKQCQMFALLGLENRIKAVKENHACFRCFKQKVTPKSVFFLSSPIKVYTELSYSPKFKLFNCMLFREISLQKRPKFDTGRCHFETMLSSDF